MANIYNVTYDCAYNWLDLSTGHNNSACVPRQTQSFTNVKAAKALVDRILDRFYQAICDETDAENRESMNADYFPSKDVYNNIQYGDDLKHGDQGYAWRYDTVNALDHTPSYESVTFILFEYFDDGYEEYKPVATVVISRAPIYESISDFDDFWKPMFDENGNGIEGYQIPKQYNEWAFDEVIDEFKTTKRKNKR